MNMSPCLSPLGEERTSWKYNIKKWNYYWKMALCNNKEHADCPHFNLLLCCCPPSHIISGSFLVSSAPRLAVLLLMYSANCSFLYSTTSSPQYSPFFISHTCSPDTFLWGIFSDMKIFLIPTVWKSLLFPTWNLTPAQSIFITLILSLVAHIPIQNCLCTILSWLNYKLNRIGRLFSYTLHKILHRSNIWFRFHPHFPITIWLTVPALSFYLKLLLTQYRITRTKDFLAHFCKDRCYTLEELLSLSKTSDEPSLCTGETWTALILTSQLSSKLLISCCNSRFIKSEWDMHF